jgi:hypothetical protein
LASRSDFLGRLLENWPAKIIAFGVALLIVLLNGLADVGERFMMIPLELELPNTLVPGEEFTGRVRVELRGDEERIFEVVEDDLRAVADFTGVTDEGVFRAPIEVRRSGTAGDLDAALEISVEPAQVTVTLEERLTRSVEITPNITGFPPAGYELSDYRISPTRVDVVGPRSRVEPLTQVLTEEISLAGREGDFTESVRLSRPDPLVSFPGGDIVDFRALIVETVIQTEFDDIEIAIVDLDPGLVVVSGVQTGTIRAQGRQLNIEDVPDERIGLFVDAAGIAEPGTYVLPVRPQIPGGILVLSIDPARIELVIAEATARVELGEEE